MRLDVSALGTGFGMFRVVCAVCVEELLVMSRFCVLSFFVYDTKNVVYYNYPRNIDLHVYNGKLCLTRLAPCSNAGHCPLREGTV